MTIGLIAYRQDATYWPPARQNGFGGMTFDAPVPEKVRWEEKAEEFINAQGVETISKSVVWTITRKKIGGYLYLGTSVAGDPTQVEGAREIQQLTQIPDLRGLHEENVNYL
jgi:hypothetical protein